MIYVLRDSVSVDTGAYREHECVSSLAFCPPHLVSCWCQLVPHHKLLTETEKTELLRRYRVVESALPCMQEDDPIALYYGLRPGQVRHKRARALRTYGDGVWLGVDRFSGNTWLTTLLSPEGCSYHEEFRNSRTIHHIPCCYPKAHLRALR